MPLRQFKNPHMQKVYDHYLASDIKDNRLSSDRAAYWNGYHGTFVNHPNLVPQRSSITYAIYVAGIDSRRRDNSL